MSPKINVYLPDDLAAEVKASGIPVSAVCQQALADAVAQARPAGRNLPDSAPTDDLSRNFTKRAYGVLADAEKAAEAAGKKPTTVDLMAALVDSGGLAVTVLRAADIDPDDVVDELRGRAQARRQGGCARGGRRARGRAGARARALLRRHRAPAARRHRPGPHPGAGAAATLRDMGLTHERALRGSGDRAVGVHLCPRDAHVQRHLGADPGGPGGHPVATGPARGAPSG